MSNIQAMRAAFACRALALGIAVAIVSPVATLAQSGSAAQSTVDRGVTVKVDPKAIGVADIRWEFTVVFDTHSADLADKVDEIATLVTPDGRTLKPTGWVGAGPGGHHREGVLTFDPPAPRPDSIELQIRRVDETAPRIFRWQL